MNVVPPAASRLSNPGLAEAIDHLIAVEFRRGGPTINSGVIDPLFRAARVKAGGPLAWGAARELLAVAEAGKDILIATGHVHPIALPFGETDGPLGAVALARMLVAVAPTRVVLLAEEVVVPSIVAACNAAGLMVRPSAALPLPRSVAVEAFPVDRHEAAEASERLLASAGAVVTVEKIGPCRGGGYRTGSGSRVDDSLAKIDVLVELANQRGIATVGIGDLGNEIGMAVVADEVVRVVKRGDEIVSTVETTHLVVAGCSNWGAYGIVAALAALSGMPEGLHDGDREAAMLEAICRAGSVDGFSTGPTREVDGAGMRTHVAFADLLHDITVIALDERTPDRHVIERRLQGIA